MMGWFRRRAEALRITTGRVARSSAFLIVRARFLIVPGWILAAVLATLYLPGPAATQSSVLGTLIPQDAPALQAEIRSVRDFGTPLLARTAVVQRDPQGLSTEAQGRIFVRAVKVNLHQDPGLAQIAGAFPITNTLKLLPASRESSTTGITFLFFDPDLNLYEQRALAESYARQIDQPGDSLIGVTGAAPARLEQGELIERALPLVEGATLALIALIVGLSFRAIGAPLATLGAAGVAYLVSIRVVAWVGQRVGVAVPQDLEPVIVVLLLGIVTDYSIFFLYGVRDRLAGGQRRLDAAEATTANFLPIIVVAGLTVAAGTAALVVARLEFVRAFGPALALTVAISLVVAITFVPAALAIAGRRLFWPHLPSAAPDVAPRDHRAAYHEPSPIGCRDRLIQVVTFRPVGLLIAVIVVAALGMAAYQLRSARLGASLIRDLPADTQESRAEAAAGEGFAPGILSPTEVLLEGVGLDRQQPALARLEDLIDGQPGVAAVLGPREEATGRALLASSGQQANLPDAGITVSKNGLAARLVLILDHDPLGGIAINDLRALEDRMPGLARRSGLTGVRISFAGDTALAVDTVERTLSDLGRIALAALLVDLLLLVVFLRSLVAPLYLLATSVLALLASLGLTTYIVQRYLGYEHLTYYVPFAVAVLLVSLGADYNIFIVGRIWEEAQARPLRDAIVVGARRATRPITLAGLALAGSFALLGLVAIRPFREFAIAMSLGVLLDSFVVRSLLVPALVSLFSRASFWPGKAPRIAENPAVPFQDAAVRSL